jgi:hypothetical protein
LSTFTFIAVMSQILRVWTNQHLTPRA